MAPPLLHSLLQKWIHQSGKLDTILFYFERKSGGAIRKLFLAHKRNSHKTAVDLYSRPHGPTARQLRHIPRWLRRARIDEIRVGER